MANDFYSSLASIFGLVSQILMINHLIAILWWGVKGAREGAWLQFAWALFAYPIQEKIIYFTMLQPGGVYEGINGMLLGTVKAGIIALEHGLLFIVGSTFSLYLAISVWNFQHAVARLFNFYNKLTVEAIKYTLKAFEKVVESLWREAILKTLKKFLMFFNF